MSQIAPQALEVLNRALDIRRQATEAGRDDLLASEQRKLNRLVQDASGFQKRWVLERGYNWNPAREHDVMVSYINDQLAGQAVERKVRFYAEPGSRAVNGSAPDADQSGPIFELANGTKTRGYRHGQPMAPTSGAEAPQDNAAGRAIVSAITGRALDTSQNSQFDASGGLFLSPTVSGQLIDAARAESVLSQAGAITLPIQGDTRIIRVDTDPTGAWQGSELSPLNSTNVVLGAVELRPKTLGCVVDVSQQLVEDSANAAETVQRVLASALAQQLDRALFRGIETGHPFTGVLTDPNVGRVSMGTNGAALTNSTAYGKYLDTIEKVETANGVPTVRIEHPRTKRALDGLVDSQLQPLRAPDAVAQLQRLTSTQLPIDQEHGSATDASSTVVGNFASGFVILGVRSQFRVEISRDAGDAFENLGLKVRCWGRYDLAIGRPGHLAVLEGIIP
ncbi:MULTISPECIES: phage major capsid protein [unclassified Nocardiopsis]|uniref:phage major capsid protein n=1 Tax=unclassified Nocardiopsis TaxID=2649073 RepID=UPI00135A33B7|nr:MULTISPECIES: phage major capsid protein [unclassified Nocardiopsis]